MQLFTGEENSGDHSEEKFSSVFPTGLITQETTSLLNSLGKGSIDQKLKQLINEKQEQSEEILQLKSELEGEKNRLRSLEKQSPKTNETQNSNGTTDSEQQKQLAKELTDLKNRVPRLEADNLSIQQEVYRLDYHSERKRKCFFFFHSLQNKRYDAQLKRQKQQIEELEKIEEDLKQERRRFQREVKENISTHFFFLFPSIRPNSLW